MNRRVRLANVIALTAFVGAMTAPFGALAQSIDEQLVSTTPEEPEHHHHHHHHHHSSSSSSATAPAQPTDPATLTPAPAPTASAQTPAHETAAHETAAHETPAHETPAHETAAADARPPATDAPRPRAGTPIPVRPNRPLSLATASPRNDSWKLLVGFAGFAVALFYWKRRAPSADASDGPELRIVRRTTLHDRGELLVVDVAGQRMLLGVTAASVQHLATLDGVEEPAASAAPAPARTRDETAARFESMLVAARAANARDTIRTTHRQTLPLSGAPRDDEVEEQVRGLVSLGVSR